MAWTDNKDEMNELDDIPDPPTPFHNELAQSYLGLTNKFLTRMSLMAKDPDAVDDLFGMALATVDGIAVSLCAFLLKVDPSQRKMAYERFEFAVKTIMELIDDRENQTGDHRHSGRDDSSDQGAKGEGDRPRPARRQRGGNYH